MSQWKGWGEDYYRFLQRGMDHGDAAFRADKAVRARQQRQQRQQRQRAARRRKEE